MGAGLEKLTLSKMLTPGCDPGLKNPGVQPELTVPRWSLSVVWTVHVIELAVASHWITPSSVAT
jgi:hypothetical protein